MIEQAKNYTESFQALVILPDDTVRYLPLEELLDDELTKSGGVKTAPWQIRLYHPDEFNCCWPDDPPLPRGHTAVVGRCEARRV